MAERRAPQPSAGPSVELPWGAWYREATQRLELPSSWHIDILLPEPARVWNKEQIDEAIHHAIDCPPIADLSRGKTTACVVVDDLARPTKASVVLPVILRELHAAGIRREGICILVATGSHRQLDDQQLGWKLGAEVAATYRVECHDASGDLANSGVTLGKTDLRLNARFLAADVKIVVGSVLPHSFAGYSGGAKLVLPGLADLEATARSHKYVQMGLRGGTDPDGNRFRREAEDVCRRLGVKFAVSVVPDLQREMAGVFAGDLVAGHRKACQIARQTYSTPVDGEYDCLILNAYPKDTDLIQAQNCLVALQTLRKPIVRQDGVLVIATAASEGVGVHGLFQPGGRSYLRPRPKRALGDRELWLYAPSVSESEARQLFWEGYPHFREARELVAALARRFPKPARVGVVPCAPTQQLENISSAPVSSGTEC